MRTPSLRRRVVTSSLAIVLGVLVVSDVFLYLTLRDSLEGALDEVLATRVDLAQELAAVMDPDELAEHLTAAGVPVVVSAADGRRIVGEPALPRFQQGPPGTVDSAEPPRVSRTIELPGGGTAEVSATRAGVDRTLERTRLFLAIGSVLAILVAVLLLRRVAAVAMAPLDQVVTKAVRTSAGHAGERLEPDDPNSELGRMATAYDQMLDSLESALEQTRIAEERTRRFVADAAHQLRTPVAAVCASVESLLRATDAEEQDRHMAHLVRETGRSSRMLKDLLTLARLDDDDPLDRRTLDVLAVVQDEVERAASLAPHLTLSCSAAAAAVPAEVDERQFREAVANLLDNARRHAQQRIEVTVARVGHTIEVVIRDDGAGITDAAHALIFERFVSLGDHHGTGLGLPIARAVARAHGGDLTHESDRFVLRLASGTGAPRAAHDG